MSLVGLGSVSDAVLHNALCPVLLVRCGRDGGFLGQQGALPCACPHALNPPRGPTSACVAHSRHPSHIFGCA